MAIGAITSSPVEIFVSMLPRCLARTITKNLGTSMGYHVTKIKRGVFGKLSKIQEELDELKDAEKQDCTIMAMVELSDLYGALREYAKREYGLSMSDLKTMADITRRAFEDGSRK